MACELHPYLNFKGKTCEAMEFYRSVFGGKLEFHTFKEYHATEDPDEENMIMHSVLKSGDIMFYAADSPSRMKVTSGTDFSMSLTGDDDGELSCYFDKLSEGGTVQMPLKKAAWGDTFGMCTDKFGVRWMVNVAGD